MSAVLAGVAGISMHADAQNYPWCAYLAVTGGATNCGFTTFEQFQGYIGGMRGFCMRNTQYVIRSPSGSSHASMAPPVEPLLGSAAWGRIST